jgi:hypothetical protein
MFKGDGGYYSGANLRQREGRGLGELFRVTSVGKGYMYINDTVVGHLIQKVGPGKLFRGISEGRGVGGRGAGKLLRTFQWAEKRNRDIVQGHTCGRERGP